MSAVNDWNAKIIEEFRANDGNVGGPFEHLTLLLLHTTGARSGAERVNPVAYLDHDGRRFVFASKGGADSDPDWFRNLVANPEVTVEVGSSSYAATATPLSGAERDRIYAVQMDRAPGFRDYQDKTTRIIPVVELTPT